MFIWIQLNNFPNSSLMTSIIFAHRIGNAYTVKILKFIRSSRPVTFRPATLLKKCLLHSCFPVNFAKFLKTLYLQNPPGGCFCFVAIEFYVFLVRGGSKAAAISKMERFLIIVNGWKPLTIIKSAPSWMFSSPRSAYASGGFPVF